MVTEVRTVLPSWKARICAKEGENICLLNVSVLTPVAVANISFLRFFIRLHCRWFVCLIFYVRYILRPISGSVIILIVCKCLMWLSVHSRLFVCSGSRRCVILLISALKWFLSYHYCDHHVRMLACMCVCVCGFPSITSVMVVACILYININWSCIFARAWMSQDRCSILLHMMDDNK